MNILLGILFVCLLFFIINTKEAFVQNYNYPIPTDPDKNLLIAQMINPSKNIDLAQVQKDLNLFNNASNILYGMQRIPLPKLPQHAS